VILLAEQEHSDTLYPSRVIGALQHFCWPAYLIAVRREGVEMAL